MSHRSSVFVSFVSFLLLFPFFIFFFIDLGSHNMNGKKNTKFNNRKSKQLFGCMEYERTKSVLNVSYYIVYRRIYVYIYSAE